MFTMVFGAKSTYILGSTKYIASRAASHLSRNEHDSTMYLPHLLCNVLKLPVLAMTQGHGTWISEISLG